MAMGSVAHLLFFLSEQCYLMPFSTYRIGTEASANPVRGRKMAAVQYRWLLRQQVTGISQLPPRLALQERKLQEVVECAAFQMPFSSVLPPPVTVHG
ncbi:hypothetical protein D4M99_23205 [Escherichia coli]|nr:hypothetical protein [Escherichia coli]ELF8902110.1 hypothetical protein [Escherichia coli]TXU81147.1 hypothetical protein D4M99_23205 [Escherichia coli]